MRFIYNLISVIIPTYNKDRINHNKQSHLLKDAIDYKNIEKKNSSCTFKY